MAIEVLPDLLESLARVRIMLAGVAKGQRRAIDLKSTDASVTFTATDDGLNEKVVLDVAAGVLDNSVTTNKIANLAVTTGKLADGAVTTVKIADGNVTQAKFASGILPTAVQTTSPTGVAGQLWYDSDDNLLYVYNGSAWVCITPQSAYVATSQTSASTSYANLATAGPSVSVVTGTKALIQFSCNQYASGGNFCNTSVDISGATTMTAANFATNFGAGVDVATNYSTVTRNVVVTGLTAGTNTFKLLYSVSAGTGNWQDRSITVVGIP